MSLEIDRQYVCEREEGREFVCSVVWGGRGSLLANIAEDHAFLITRGTIPLVDDVYPRQCSSRNSSLWLSGSLLLGGAIS